jgi:heptosyltransferase-2
MSAQRILVVSPSWIGDMVMSQTLYALLKKHDKEIDVIAPAASKPLLSRMPEVNRSMLFDVGHGELRFGYRRQFAGSLRRNNYQQAIVLPNSLKSALVPFLADIPVRTGFRGEMRYILLNDIRLLDERRLPRMIDRFMALGLPAMAPLQDPEPPQLTVDGRNQTECLRQLRLNTKATILGMCPGAEFGDAKRWPESKFAEVARAAIERGMQVWIFGSAADRSISDTIIKQIPSAMQGHCQNLAGRTTLLDAIDLLSLCGEVVTNDSGLMHVAAALGCKTVVLYGSTSPTFTPPLTEKAIIISEDIACSPCFKRTCPLGHKNCLNLLDASQVISRLQEQ